MICTQNSILSSACTCSSFYYPSLPSNFTTDYTQIISTSTTPYNNRISSTVDSALNLLPLNQNKDVGYLRCAPFFDDSRFSVLNFITNFNDPTLDNDTQGTSIMIIASVHIRCIEDVWESPFGDAFSGGSQNYVYNFMRAQTITDINNLWVTLTSAMTPDWVSGNTTTYGDVRSLLWWWTLPNNPGYSDPPNGSLTGKSLLAIKTAGFPYTMYSYDSLEFSSYCPLYAAANFDAFLPGDIANPNYYTFASGVDTGITGPTDNSWWIRYVPMASSGSLYIKWPAFVASLGGNTEILMKTNFLPFYNAMISAPISSARFAGGSWIMRIGFEYLKRPNDVANFMFWPPFMRSTLISIYSQYCDMKVRLIYINLYQILIARYSGVINYGGPTGTNTDSGTTLYLSEYNPPSNSTLVNTNSGTNITNLIFSLRNTVPFLADGIDPNSLTIPSNYPLSIITGNNAITTAFTGTELGVSYTSSIRSSASLVFKDPNINSNAFGSLLLYTAPGGFATDPSVATGVATLEQLFGVDGMGQSFSYPVPREAVPPIPFNVTDPDVVTPTKTTTSVFDFLSTSVLLYILIGAIALILIIGFLVYFIRRSGNKGIPEAYRTNKYEHVLYESI